MSSLIYGIQNVDVKEIEKRYGGYQRLGVMKEEGMGNG
jgi:hypothetical protein